MASEQPSTVVLADRSPTGTLSGLIIGTAGPQGGISKNPADHIARRIRSALAGHPIPDILVYDGAGKLIRRLDGLTKKEKPL